MRINFINLQDLIKTNFRNNKTWFCEEIHIDRSYLYKMKERPSRCKKLCDNLSKYCNENNLNINNYIFFD